MANIIKFGHTPNNDNVTYNLDGFPLVHVGEFSYITELCVLTYNSPPPIIHIGRYCSIAEDVKFLLVADHPYDFVTTYPMFHNFTSLTNQIELIKSSGTKTKMDNFDIGINVGSDVWIGHGASVLPGVNVGHGAVIGAFSVVAKDIPPYAIVVGNPAKVIKYRFNPEQIERLLNLRWWDWDHKKIVNSINQMISINIESFLKIHES